MAEEFPVSADKLRKLVKKSRQMPIAFGFNAGTSDDDDEYLAAHERKAPELMGKIAKTEGAGTKSAYGTFVAEGSEMKLTCFQTIGQLAKKFKKYLKVNKITLNVIVMDPDGNVIDSDVEVLENWFVDDDDADDDGAAAPARPPVRPPVRPAAQARPAPPAAPDTASAPPGAPTPPAARRPAPVPPPESPPRQAAAPRPKAAPGPQPAPQAPRTDPEMQDRTDRLRDIQAKLRALPPAVAERLMPDLQRAVALLRDRRFDEADKAMQAVVTVLARIQLAAPKPKPKAPAPAAVATPAPRPQARTPDVPVRPPAGEVAARMRGALDALRRQADGLPGAATAELRPVLDRAAAALRAGEAEAALAAMRQVRDRLRDVQAARQKWGKVRVLMQGPVGQAVSGGGLANPAALQRRWVAVAALAEEGRWADALAAVPGIAALVRHAVLSARKTTA
jgi:hypothetical protein